MTLTGLEVQFHVLRQNAIKQGSDELLVDVLARNLETERVNTLVQNVECLGICSLGIFYVNLLTYKPKIVVLLVTTNEWEFTGQRIDCFEVFQILAAVERLYIEAFVGPPNQLLLEVCTFEVYLNLVQPLLCGGCLELREEFFLVVSHKISIKML